MEVPLKENADLSIEVETPLPKVKDSCFNNIKLFLAALSFSFFTKVLCGSYMKSSITQIERRFDIPSSFIGVIDGSFEMGNVLMIAFVSYFGANLHRPRLIAAGSLLMGLGTFMIALPHFFMGSYKYETTVTYSSNSSMGMSITQCSVDPKHQLSTAPTDVPSSILIDGSDCKKEPGSSLWIYVFVGNVLRGIGETPIGPLGISYLDDHATQENASFYIGILHTVALLGPVFGYLLGSYCAKIFVDIGFVDMDKVTINSKDSRWVGAWWLGILIGGVITILSAIPFWFFPKSLPKELKKDQDMTSEKKTFLKENQSDSATTSPDPVKVSALAKDFFPSIKKLLSNRIYILILLMSILQMNALIGLITFKPKFIEQQYGQSASKANFIIGSINIPAVAIGIFSGGLVMKKFQLNVISAAKLAFGSSILGWLFTLPFFAMGCENSHVAGLTVSYEGRTQISPAGSQLFHDCNANCFCSQLDWDPVCGKNGISYASPCLAGCKVSSGTGKNIKFQNCSCIPDSPSGNFSAYLGQCPRGPDCDRIFPYFMALSVISAFTYAFGGVAGYILLLRSNEPALKSLALGIYILVSRTLAGIPAPVYFGALIDMTCLKWGSKRCGGRGACRIYDSDQFSKIYLGLQAGLRGISYFVCFPVFVLLKKRFALEEKQIGVNGGTEMAPVQKTDDCANDSNLVVKPDTCNPEKENPAYP
uniref:Solute carrier organic anion transporter family member n=1 Tax=Callorhinchus milii TaxID=7868 RepID=A0A4W3J2K5_CALMI|eukprot:gi/632971684/ref/XP_007902292.1/ PREDICTED: solute carrier organic anion transporter family member 1C1-like isoform X1 [Callorhinchus milii]